MAVITPAQRAQRSAAGKRSGGARSGRDQSGADHSISGQMPATSDPDVDAQIAAYVAIVGDPQGWTEVKALEQTRAEIYRTRAAAREDELARGRLFTRDQVTERDEIHNAAIKEALATVTDLIAKHVPPERITAAQAEARAWADGVLTAVADAIEGQ
jgi:hypothetical protein